MRPSQPPLPELELERIRIQPGESETWEKELLGASLAESPISRINRNLGDIEPNMCGDISPEQDGQKVILVGQLSSFRTGTTRRGDPFGAAVMEDISGSIEVVGWKEVYQRTQALWVDGSILKVEGRVRLRNGDRVSVHCNSVQKFDLPTEDDESETPPVIPAPEPVEDAPGRESIPSGVEPSIEPTANGAVLPEPANRSGEDSPRPAAGPPRRIEGSTERNGEAPPAHPEPAPVSTNQESENGAAHPTPTVIPAEAGRRFAAEEIYPPPSADVPPPTTPGEVWLKIRATGDDTQDAEMLKDALTIAKQCPGPSALFLRIEERSRITHLEVPGVQVEYSPRLVKLLSPRLGDGAITLARD